jgi:TRAP-type mannitol/chloroaromatic compound transport system substrate-binding protein
MEGTLEEYNQLSDALEPILQDTRQKIINFEMSREELAHYSLAIDRLTNQFLILRNYCSYYLEQVNVHQYNKFYLDSTNSGTYADPEELTGIN